MQEDRPPERLTVERQNRSTGWYLRRGLNRLRISWPALSVACLIAATALSASGLAADVDQAAPLKRIFGTDKANVLRGTAKSDFIDGRGGNDVLQGLAGDDKLYGGAGTDRLIGGAGSDLILCGRGRDVAIADRLDRVARDCEDVRGGSPPARVVPEQLLGVWKRNVTFDPSFDPSWNGVWSINFDRLGFLETSPPAGAQGLVGRSTSLVSATQDGQLVIGTSSRCLVTGIYRWEIADAVLRIRKVSDGNDCNRAIVYSGDWTR
jgi:Ca2+-binding RTX toxin-like protein